MTGATPYFIPKDPGRWRALSLAVMVHAALLALLWVGIRWQSETPVTVEAEVWSPQTREAAPLAEPIQETKAEPIQETKPEPVKEIKPEPRPVIKDRPKPVVEERPVVNPAIALEQKRKEREKVEREDKERKEKDREDERLAKAKKTAEEQLARNEKIKDQAKEKKADAEQKKKQGAAEAKLLAKVRDDEMRRISGATGSGGTGDAPKAQGPRADPNYVNGLSAKIKSRTIFIVPSDLSGNPSVEYTVELFPDGSVKKIKKERSSQISGFDEAVERAINDASPYPADKSGLVPKSFRFTHQPKEKL